VWELKEAQKATKDSHEAEWMAKLVTGPVEPDEVRGGQVADDGLVEMNIVRGTPSVAVDGTRCGKAFMPGEVGYQDDESDEWTTDDVEII